jgi:hypothetical protein
MAVASRLPQMMVTLSALSGSPLNSNSLANSDLDDNAGIKLSSRFGQSLSHDQGGPGRQIAASRCPIHRFNQRRNSAHGNMIGQAELARTPGRRMAPIAQQYHPDFALLGCLPRIS